MRGFVESAMKKLLLSSLLILTQAGCSQADQDCGQLPEDEAVGNAGCLIQRGEAVLLVQQQVSGAWGLPGGTAKAGERAACTAARETLEETGLGVEVNRHLQTLENGFHIFHCNVAEATSFEPRDSLEIRQAAWKTAEERRELDWRFPRGHAQLEALLELRE